MPRRKRLRRIMMAPSFSGFKPYGVASEKQEVVELLYEEYETIKLADYDGMNHQDAAELMGISRPTFARIYDEARQKIAKALVETKEIKTVYGNVVMDKDWFVCEECKTRFTIPKTFKEHKCAICSSKNIKLLNK